MKIEELLLHMTDRRASDLHFTAEKPPQLRINGELIFTDHDSLSSETIKELAYSILSQDQIKTFEQTKELDISFGIQQVSRFRINIFYQRGTVAVAIRRISHEIPTIEELGLPKELKEFCKKSSGLFLASGPAGSGKSTTLASMIEHINNTRKARIITIEDPIEYLYKHGRCTINQRELGGDTLSFSSALKHVLRQDPDILLVGEMRDLETMQAVLTLAETGHLIFSTLHSRSASHAISRIIDVFPPHQQSQIRLQLSLVLQGIIVQQLLSHKNGQERIVSYELMNVLPSISSLIKENTLGQIHTFIHSGAEYGMKTMNQCLAQLYKHNKVTKEEICKHSDDLIELNNLIKT